MILRLERVAKLFGNFAALKDATAQFDKGKLYVITGENGAGKSTLLRIIAGLLSPSRGRVQCELATGRIGYMAHSTMLYDELTGMENLLYFGTLYGASAAQCEMAMRTVGLDPELTRAVSKYSQGMRQRLALARAIIHSPSLLLLDEPFSNLDVQSAQHLVSVLGGYRNSGNCVILVTHQPSLLSGTADDWMHLSGGVLKDVGTTERLNPEVFR